MPLKYWEYRRQRAWFYDDHLLDAFFVTEAMVICDRILGDDYWSLFSFNKTIKYAPRLVFLQMANFSCLFLSCQI